MKLHIYDTKKGITIEVKEDYLLNEQMERFQIGTTYENPDEKFHGEGIGCCE